MNRRTALKTIGMLIACSSGQAVLAEESLFKFTGDYFFDEKGLRNIIIKRKSGKKIVIPFSDIFDVLES